MGTSQQGDCRIYRYRVQPPSAVLLVHLREDRLARPIFPVAVLANRYGTSSSVSSARVCIGPTLITLYHIAYSEVYSFDNGGVVTSTPDYLRMLRL